MWNNRNVLIILASEFVAGIGMWLGIIGNLEFLQNHVQSDFHKSFIIFLGLLMGILFGPAAGRAIDKFSKKKVLIYSGLFRAITVSFMFFAIQTSNVIFMVLFIMCLNISAAYYFPAIQATIPLVVNDNKLLALNGIHMNVNTIARIIGTAVAGILLLKISLMMLYVYSMLAYFIITLFNCFLRFEEDKNTSLNIEEEKKKTGFMETFKIIKENRLVSLGLLLSFVPVFFIGSINLTVLKISVLQDDASIKGLLYTFEGVFFMLGASLIKRASVGKNIIPILIMSASGIAISEFLLFFAQYKSISIIAFSIIGFALGSFFPLLSTLFQKSVPKDLHGRFFSFRNMLDRITFQIVLLSTGALLDLIGLQKMVVVFGGFSVFLITYYIFLQRRHPLTFVNEKNGIEATTA
jgi:MFS family permease